MVILNPVDQAGAFPGRQYKLFEISHDHFFVLLDSPGIERPEDYLVDCFVAKFPPAHLLPEYSHWIHKASFLDPSAYDRNNNVKIDADGRSLIRWGAVQNYIANARFDI